MCSICGVINSDPRIAERSEPIEAMGYTMRRRGPDQTGLYISGGASLQHNRLSIIDLENGLQPMSAASDGYGYTIVYNGELYNTPELTRELTAAGVRFKTRCDTEVVLQSYIKWGEDCPSHLNGIFAFAVLDEKLNRLFLTRDRFGIKPLYYAERGGLLMFASELKALLAHPDIKHEIDRKGLWELLFMTPVMRIGSGLYKGIHSLEPAHRAIWTGGKLTRSAYWKLEALPFEDTEEQSVANTRDILTDAIRRQLVSDVPLCTFMSGGLDSSIVSAVAADQYRREGRKLSTYSFEYENNKEFFKKSLFQPQSDDEYASWLANEIGTNHHILTVTPLEVADALPIATELRDFPGQADIDSSLYLYCKKVREDHTVALSGECADEIFGGYPWFYRPEMLQKPFYPWLHDPFARTSLFKEGAIHAKEGYEWLCGDYQSDLAKCPILPGDTPDMLTARRATWLSTRYFMASLLDAEDQIC